MNVDWRFSRLWHSDVLSVMLQDFEPPSGDIKSAIEKDFGSVEELSKKFNAKAATVQVWRNQFFEFVKTLSVNLIDRPFFGRVPAGAG